ncbi:MAG: hypothetical protein A2W26_01910 [Acidobacteria bacterium RBG_16_64_8]|nr:MAG: hypothetical protein A2W26_01910 [Acidobacteria bacterium RBG_16_64_8]
MSTITVRPLREEEIPAAVEVSCAAFGERPTQEEREIYQHSFDVERSLCAFDADTMVGTSLALSLELTLPGPGVLPVGGLTWVAVLPTQRRRGILRQLVAGQFEDMVRRGEPASALIASEGNIYSRFGYGPATSAVSFSVERAQAAFIRPVRAEGRIVLLTDEEAAAELPAIYERIRRLQPGRVTRSDRWWTEYLFDPQEQREGGGGMFHAKYATSPGVADGYVTYRFKEETLGWTSRTTLLVVELLAADPGVYSALWDYVLNTDLVHTVSFSRGRVDEPLRWLLADPRALTVSAMGDDLWIRLLDIPRALHARTYGAAGDIVFEVDDTFLAPNRTTFALRVGQAEIPDIECAVTTARAELALGTSSLAAAYLGGVSFATLAAAGLVRELRQGSVGRADAMFSAATAPYCGTIF